MTTRGIRLLSPACFVSIVIGAAACGGSSAPPGGAAAGPGTASKGPVVAGERFTVRVIDDKQQAMPVGVVSAPEKWKFSSDVVWNYGWVSNPVAVSERVENPDNEEAVFGYPAAQYFALRPAPGSYYQAGTNFGGLIYGPVGQPVQTMASLIRRARANVAKLELVGSKDLPGLPAALKLPPAPNQRGVGVKATYELNGKSVEEEFYGVFYSLEIPYDGPQGRTYQINWGLGALHSFRAPAGTLDKRRPVFAAVAKSFRPNPAWQQRLEAINQYLAGEFNRQLQAGYDRIAAAAALSRQISANNDAMIASIDRSLQASRANTSAEARSAASKFDDYVRGVETVDDPYYGTSQHSTNEQFHWTDGYGNYRNTNETTYDPNRTEVGNWVLMKPIR